MKRTLIGILCAVIDWTHRFGVCGYDLDKHRAEGVYEHISEVSLPDGSCRNTEGVKCVFNVTVKHYVCEDLNDLDHPYLQHEFSFTVSSILHELFHPFGMEGNFDHFGTEICISALGGQLSTEPFAFQHNFGICPNVIEKFSHSYTGCPND